MLLLPLELCEGGGGQFDDDEGGGCVGAGGGGDGVAGGGGEAYTGTGGLHGLSHAAHIVHSTSYFDPAQVFALTFCDNKRSCSMMSILKDDFKGRVDFIVRI